MNIGDITDDQVEQLLAFVQQISRFSLYHDAETDVDDAADVLNSLILKARKFTAEPGDSDR